MRVLLIEDELSVVDAIQLMLSTEGFAVDTANLAEDGLVMAGADDYDIILLDLGLPDMPGHELLARLRSANVETPVIIVTASHDLDSKVRAFVRGADDYLTKPFGNAELLARIHAVMRRCRGPVDDVIRLGNLSIDTASNAVSVGDVPIHLPPKEYAVLKVLARHRGRSVSAAALLNHLHDGIAQPSSKTIAVYISHLRAKLARASNGGTWIRFERGSGYVLDPPANGCDDSY